MDINYDIIRVNGGTDISGLMSDLETLPFHRYNQEPKTKT